MSSQGIATRTLASSFLYEAQTLFMTAKPAIRYPLAILFGAMAAYLFSLPHFDMNYVAAYTLFAGVYAWELSVALAVMAAIFGIFKLLALLPLGLAVVIVAVAILYIGV